MKTTFALIADTHFGPARHQTEENLNRVAQIPSILRDTVQTINAHKDIEFVVHLGDLVQECRQTPSREQDLQSAAAATDILSKLRAPLYHVTGNHDSVTLSEQDLLGIFNTKNLYYSFETSTSYNIVLHCESPGHVNVHFPPGELAWLKQQLLIAQKPVIIFMHQLLVEHPLAGTSCEGIPDCAYVTNRTEILDLLETSGKVQAVFNGHMHHNLFKIERNIPFFTIQALTEFAANARATETIAFVTTDEKFIDVQIIGHDPANYSYSLGSLERTSQ